MKCANPHCNAEGLYLRSGSLHALDIAVAGADGSGAKAINRRIVWLCGDCTSQFDIETWRPPGQQLRPRSKESASDLKFLLA